MDSAWAGRDDDRHQDAVARVEQALLDPAVSHMVDLVARRDPGGAPDTYEVAAVDGRVRFRRSCAPSARWHFTVERVEGRDPLADQSVTRFSPLADERAHPHPDRTTNAYPFAFEQVAQLFDAAVAPDLVVLHTAAHNWADQGGHLGEHGSLGVVQARAPLLVSGPGFRDGGLVEGAGQLVDVAPTVLQLLGCPRRPGVGLDGSARPDALLARQDGGVLHALLDEDAAPPDHLIGFLLDGSNANVLYDAVARGVMPNVARLLARGSGLRHGAMSSLPTVTLANHTSILTGAHPGHHGVVHNAWYDRRTREQVITNSPFHWMRATDHLAPGIETIHSVVKRSFPGAVSVSINEPCDRDADYSIFERMRQGDRLEDFPVDELPPHATERFVRPSKDYRLSSLIDHLGLEQCLGIWGGHHQGRSWPTPRFTWVNFSLTDAAFHEGGPYSAMAEASLVDTDARIGDILAAVERAGVFDRTAFFLTADHGMEQSDPSCTGNWAEAIDDTGVPYRDEGYGFIYVDP